MDTIRFFFNIDGCTDCAIKIQLAKIKKYLEYVKNNKNTLVYRNIGIAINNAQFRHLDNYFKIHICLSIHKWYPLLSACVPDN